MVDVMRSGLKKKSSGNNLPELFIHLG